MGCCCYCRCLWHGESMIDRHRQTWCPGGAGGVCLFSVRLKWSHSARTNDVENVRAATQEQLRPGLGKVKQKSCASMQMG